MEVMEGQDVSLVKGAAVRVMRGGRGGAVLCEVVVGNERFEAMIPVELLRPRAGGVAVNLRHLERSVD